MEQLYEDTIRKIDYLEARGFEVIQKWECELKKEMKEDEDLKRYIDEYELVDPLHPREAFYGGRTNASKLYHECKGDDEERAILGTWCHVELMKAIEKGYEVVEIHEVWHWEQTTDELFSPYVNMFLKIKQEASGYPKHCVTDEQKQQYIDDYYEHEGIRLDPNKIVYNSGLRWLAKLMLNSLWGT